MDSMSEEIVLNSFSVYCFLFEKYFYSVFFNELFWDTNRVFLASILR